MYFRVGILQERYLKHRKLHLHKFPVQTDAYRPQQSAHEPPLKLSFRKKQTTGSQFSAFNLLDGQISTNSMVVSSRDKKRQRDLERIVILNDVSLRVHRNIEQSSTTLMIYKMPRANTP